jgi:hypothetical protein
VTHTPTPYEVETFSGRYVNTKDPQVESIDLGDIAHALSHICRYGGHCSRFYSVAEHSVAVSKRLERKGASLVKQLGGLHHDDTESYLGDIPRPLKGLLRSMSDAYDVLTDQMDAVICEALGLTAYGITPALFHDEAIKDADNWMLFVEAKAFLPSGGINWSGSQLDDWGVRQDGLPSRIVTPDYFYSGVTPAAAKSMYLERHIELLEKLA